MVSLSIETSCKFLSFARSHKFARDVYKSPNLVGPCWRNIPSRTLLFTNVYAKASVTRRAIVAPLLTTNLEIAIVLMALSFRMPLAIWEEIVFWVRRRRAEGYRARGN